MRYFELHHNISQKRTSTRQKKTTSPRDSYSTDTLFTKNIIHNQLSIHTTATATQRQLSTRLNHHTQFPSQFQPSAATRQKNYFSRWMGADGEGFVKGTGMSLGGEVSLPALKRLQLQQSEMLLPMFCCLHWQTTAKYSTSRFLIFSLASSWVLGFCEENFVTNNRGGSRERWCWWVGSSCIVYLSGGVDEKNESAYIGPDDTTYNAPLENPLTPSPFPDAHLPLLGARSHSVDLSLSPARSSASRWSSSSNYGTAIRLLTPLERAESLC